MSDDKKIRIEFAVKIPDKKLIDEITEIAESARKAAEEHFGEQYQFEYSVEINE